MRHGIVAMAAALCLGMAGSIGPPALRHLQSQVLLEPDDIANVILMGPNAHRVKLETAPEARRVTFDIALLIGRILVALLFLVAAYNKFNGLAGTVAYFTRLGVPAPSIVAPLAAAFELASGILLLVGFKTRLVALAIAGFVIIAALLAHTNFADGNQLNHFLKNFAIVGGCLALFVTGAGAYSMDAKRG